MKLRTILSQATSDDLEGALQFAKLYECQLFVSTHSAECLESAAALAQENQSDFSNHSTVLEDGETKVRQFDGDKFVEALEEQIDIR